jgi:putative ABC transport system ATP-binding protein
MTVAGDPVLQVSGVRKSFTTPAGSATVLDGIDLAVHGGEIVALAGRSGSGKTVLLTVIAGWEQPDAGTVVLPRSAGLDAGPNGSTGAGADAGGAGADGAGGGAERPWRELAVVPQSLGLLDELTVEENILLPHRLDPRRRPGDTPHELAARLGIDHLAGRFPSEISRGEQQRVALARAATLGPRLLLADEPIAHQNEAWAEVVLAVIADLASGGTACLLATHDELAFRAAHRVVHLTNGRLDPLGRVGDGDHEPAPRV